MRIGVLDVGSNTVHLLLVDAHWGASPVPVVSERWALKLAALIGPDGALGPSGRAGAIEAIGAAAEQARRAECDEMLAFATSAIRDATDSDEVIAEVERTTGVHLQVLSGSDEARFTFLAARRWFGWSAGNLLVLDIGGGSLEIAGGADEKPSLAESLPLGAGRMHREWFVPRSGVVPNFPPGADAVAELHAHASAVLEPVAAQIVGAGPFDRVVATSKTFRTLARLTGAAPSDAGIWTPRELALTALRQVMAFIARMSPVDVGALEGVSEDRAEQLAAGAAVALAAMEAAGTSKVDICPWALREGVILQRLDQMAFSS